jgi:branched-chain amino acid transport system substrate-binding protein
MKKSGVLTLFVSISFLLSFVMPLMGAITEAAAQAKAPIKIGHDNCISGIMAGLGKYTYMGIDAWGKKMQKVGGFLGHPVQVYLYDNESDATKAVLNVKKLINTDKVHVVIGSSSTGIALAEGPVCAEGKTPFIGTTGAAIFESKIKEAGAHHWCFRMNNVDPSWQMGMYLYGLREVHKVNKVALLVGEDAMGRAMAADFEKEAPRYGTQIILKETFPADAVTFGAQISKVKAQPEIGGIFVSSSTLAAVLLIAALRDAGIKVPVVIDQACATLEHMKLKKVRDGFKAGPVYCITAIDIYDSLPEGLSLKVGLTKYRNFWKEEFGEIPTTSFQIFGLTSTTIIEDAVTRLLRNQPDIFDKDLTTIRSAIRDYIETIKNINLGPSGIFSPTPDDHRGWQWGTGFVIGKYGQDEKWHYAKGWYPSVRPPLPTK